MDIKVLKEKYQIGFIDEYGVLFVEKKDARLFSDWEMKYTVRSARELEEELFTEDGVNAVNV